MKFLRVLFGRHEIKPKGVVMKEPRPWWFWFWMVWLGIFVVAETVALVDSDRGDSFSETMWFLQRSWWPLTAILALVLIFLIWHFIIDRRNRK